MPTRSHREGESFSYRWPSPATVVGIVDGYGYHATVQRWFYLNTLNLMALYRAGKGDQAALPHNAA